MGLGIQGSFTLSIIKPEPVRDKQVGKILTLIEEQNFEILALMVYNLSASLAGKFYEMHKSLPFYDELCQYMASGPVIPMVLKRENAVNRFRTLIGATNPAQAAPGTIRNLFGKSIQSNAIHGSDTPESAHREVSFFFPSL